MNLIPSWRIFGNLFTITRKNQHFVTFVGKLRITTMAVAEAWSDLMFDLSCLSKQHAKREFRQSIKYSFGGLCAYCRNHRATTLDHIRPRSKGGSNLRSNLLPSCLSCNNSKGSETWLSWYERQEFFNEVAKELIEEWITNKRFEEAVDEGRTHNRTKVCTTKGTLRSDKDEQTCVGEDCLAPA